ncbi:hypothetical protein BC833DRAFT_598948 [Globomyces pollinis-pini]|nr:hypothetical protein BC833DRAFT_598948 [Globomyces pollinis-pini]
MDDIQSEQWWIVVVKYTLPLVIAVLVLYNMKKGDSTSQTTDKPVVKTYQIHKERSKLNSKELNHHENIQPKGEMICEELENVHEGRDSIKSNREDELLGTTITDDNHLESPTNTQDDEVKQNVANSTTNGNSLGSDLSEFVNDEIPSVMSENNDDTVNLLVNNLHSTEGVSLDERVSSFEPESDVEVPGQIARTEEVDKTLNANIIDNNSVGVETVTIVTESDESKNPESSVELDADIDNAQYEHQQNKHGDELKATPEANMGNNDHQSESETLSESTDVNKNSVFDVLGSKSFAVTSKENDCSGSPKSFTSEQIKAEFFEDISIGDCDYQNGMSVESKQRYICSPFLQHTRRH